MEVEFIDRILKSTLLVAVLLFVFLTYFFTLQMGVGVLVGAIWGCANFYMIKEVLKKLIFPGVRSALQIIFVLIVKFPLLYLAGYGLLMIPYFKPLYLIIGFSLFFPLILLNSIFRRKSLDESGPSSRIP